MAEYRRERGANINTRRSSTTVSSARRGSKDKVKLPKTKRVKRNSSGPGKIYVVLFVLFVVYIAGYTLRFFAKESLTYDTVVYGTIDVPKKAEGIIIRDETVYKTSKEGIVSFNAIDGQKVKTGDVIFTIKNEEDTEQISENLEKINEDILQMQEQREDFSWFADDVKKVNNQIKDLVDNNANIGMEESFSYVYELKNNIERKLETRNQMLLSENVGSLKNLSDERLNAEKKLQENILSVAAVNGGIISYYTDGLEENINIQSLDLLSKEQTQMKVSKSNEIKTKVFADDVVCRVVNSNTWYIASYIDNGFVEGWEVGDRVNLNIKDNNISQIIEGKVIKLNNLERETYTVFEITKNLTDFIEDRNVKFEIGESRTGYKIPNSAIKEETLCKIPLNFIDNNTVCKVTEKGGDYINISYISSDTEGIVLVPSGKNSVNVGDTLKKLDSTEGNFTIKDTVKQNGIYVTNTGMTQFEKLNMEGSVKNSTHTIIDPNKNPNIKIYDRIATELEEIES